LKKLRKKGEKGNGKTNFIFWNFKDHKKMKNGGIKKKTNTRKKPQKIIAFNFFWKRGHKPPKNSYIKKKQTLKLFFFN
jgi:hypothetical protein